MNKRIKDELPEMIRPIASLISKSEKVQQKLSPGTWQHAKLHENLRALRLAFALLSGKADGAEAPTPEDVQAALRAFDELTAKSEKAQARFVPGTSQHTLQRNRLKAFRAAQTLIIERCA